MNKPNNTIELASDPTEISAEELEQQEQRRRALRSMLSASEARQEQVKRTRLPTMAVGVRVLISSGPHKHQCGTILDADFIHGRALVDLADELGGHWIEFNRLMSDNTPAS